MPRRLLLLMLALATACSNGGGSDDDDDSTPLPDDDDTTGPTADDDDDSSGDDTADDDDDTTPGPDYWAPEKNVGTEMQETPRGWQYARGIIHLHSTYSHDACDGDPLPDGVNINGPCKTSLRTALCTTAIDYAMLTDHPTHMDEFDFEELFLAEPGDEMLREEGRPVANRISCPDRDILLTVGWEDNVMPVMLQKHLHEDQAERHRIYNNEDAETVDGVRDAGGLVLVAHSESRTVERLRAVAPDGMEIYNLHANIDPNIRPDWLGLEAFGYLADAAPFLNYFTNPTPPHPDLVFLSFFLPNEPSLTKWETLMGERHITAHAGTDAHENSLPAHMGDAERVDSYRRMIKWFSNWLMVKDRTPTELKAALKAGRNLIVFDILGTPLGFDFHAGEGDAVQEMGGTVAVGTTIHATLPEMYNLDPALEQPEIRLVLIHVGEGGVRTSVAESAEDLDFVADQPGAYRMEVHIVPHHLKPWLPGLDNLIHDFVWIYTNPIYVE